MQFYFNYSNKDGNRKTIQGRLRPALGLQRSAESIHLLQQQSYRLHPTGPDHRHVAAYDQSGRLAEELSRVQIKAAPR